MHRQREPFRAARRGDRAEETTTSAQPCRPSREAHAGSMQVTLPIARHAACGPRRRLIEWMVLRRGELRTVVVLLGRIVPEPVLARLKAADEVVAGIGRVGARVTRGGGGRAA